jgi:hypothetical protein
MMVSWAPRAAAESGLHAFRGSGDESSYDRNGALLQERPQALFGAMPGWLHERLGATVVVIGDDQLGRGDGDTRHSQAGDGASNQRGRQTFANSGDGVESARGELAEERGAAQQTVQFVEDGLAGARNLHTALGILHQRIQGGFMLGAQLLDELQRDFLVAGFSVVGSLYEAIGHAAHGRDDHDHRVGGNRGLNDGGGATHAIGVADRSATEFHDAKRRAHCRFPPETQFQQKSRNPRLKPGLIYLSLPMVAHSDHVSDFPSRAACR